MMTWTRRDRRVTLRWIFACLLMFGIAVANGFPAQSSPKTVVYSLSSSDSTAPTLVWYRHRGDQVYDGLNWGNSDGDTLPWSLAVEDVGALSVSAQSSRMPSPTYTCTVTVDGVVKVRNTGLGSVQCNVGF